MWEISPDVVVVVELARQQYFGGEINENTIYSSL